MSKKEFTNDDKVWAGCLYPEGYRWIATDENGETHAFKGKPSRFHDYKGRSGGIWLDDFPDFYIPNPHDAIAFEPITWNDEPFEIKKIVDELYKDALPFMPVPEKPKKGITRLDENIPCKKHHEPMDFVDWIMSGCGRINLVVKDGNISGMVHGDAAGLIVAAAAIVDDISSGSDGKLNRSDVIREIETVLTAFTIDDARDQGDPM